MKEEKLKDERLKEGGEGNKGEIVYMSIDPGISNSNK